MFEKLLSIIPYNPSAIEQLYFYARRIRQEKSVRRIAVIFIVLGFIVQFFAVISPSQPSLAYSPNDLVNGGFSSAAEAASDCRTNLYGYGTILANYGINCNTVANANTITINSTDWNHQLFSMGRLPYSIPGETPVSIAGSTFYVRYLWGWDRPGTTSTYQALNVTSPGGQTFLLLYACGNLTSVGLPAPVQQPPAFSLSKNTLAGYPISGSNVSPGTILGYQVDFANSGGAATNVRVTDNYPNYVTPYSMEQVGTNPNFNNANSTANWFFPNMPAGATGYYVNVLFKVNPNVPNGAQICNTANLVSSQTTPQNTNTICMTAVNKPVTPTETPQPITPQATCPYAPTIPLNSPTCIACQTNNKILASATECKSCLQAVSSENSIACIIPSKSVSNVTEGINDANNTTAQAGDTIKYVISAKNSGTQTVNNYLFQDNLNYVLDYSSLSDPGGGTLNTSNKVLSWPAVTISPNQTVSETFEVKIDNPIPQTPTSTSDPNYFNLVMSNTYGNTVKINLPPGPTRIIAATTGSLPNTGPGSSILIIGVIMIIAGYFYYRSRLILKESNIVIKDTTPAGV